MRQGAGNAISIMGSPTDLEQLHDRRHVERRHGARHAGRDPVGRRHPGVQGADDDVLGRVRLQRQPDQPGQQDQARTTFHGTGFGFMRNEALRRAQLLRLADRGQAQARSEAVRRRRWRTGDAAAQDKTFFLVNYEGTRIERGFTNFYTVPSPADLSGHFSTTIIDPQTGQPFPNNTIPLRASRGSRSWRCGTTGSRRRTRTRRRATTSTCGPSAGSGPVHDPRSTSTLGKLRSGRSAATRTPAIRTAPRCNADRHRRPGVRAGHEELAGLPQLGDQVEPREPVPRRARRGAGRPARASHARSLTWTSSDVTGTFTNMPDDQRECPSIGMQGYAGTGGAMNAYTASNQPMWDIGNSTTYVAGAHNLSFGFNYRRWQLQRDLATGFLGNYSLQRRLHRQRRRRHAARLLLGRRRVPAGRLQRPGRSRATRASSTSCTSRRTCRTTGKSARG